MLIVARMTIFYYLNPYFYKILIGLILFFLPGTQSMLKPALGMYLPSFMT